MKIDDNTNFVRTILWSSYLGDGVSSELRRLDSLVNYTEWNDIPKALDLVYGGVCVRQARAVIHAGSAIITKHTNDLLMTALWLHNTEHRLHSVIIELLIMLGLRCVLKSMSAF